MQINVHGGSDDHPYCEVEASAYPTIGGVINFYCFRDKAVQVDEGGPGKLVRERYCVLTLSYSGALGLLRFLPPLLSESRRLSNRR